MKRAPPASARRRCAGCAPSPPALSGRRRWWGGICAPAPGRRWRGWAAPPRARPSRRTAPAPPVATRPAAARPAPAWAARRRTGRDHRVEDPQGVSRGIVLEQPDMRGDLLAGAAAILWWLRLRTGGWTGGLPGRSVRLPPFGPADWRPASAAILCRAYHGSGRGGKAGAGALPWRPGTMQERARSLYPNPSAVATPEHGRYAPARSLRRARSPRPSAVATLRMAVTGPGLRSRRRSLRRAVSPPAGTARPEPARRPRGAAASSGPRRGTRWRAAATAPRRDRTGSPAPGFAQFIRPGQHEVLHPRLGRAIGAQ